MLRGDGGEYGTTIGSMYPHPNLLVAITWQAIASLWRQVGVRYRLALEEVHPGISMRGMIYLYVDVVNRPGLVLKFHLGGPNPGVVELGGHHEPEWRLDLANTVLREGLDAGVSAMIDRLRLPELPKGPPPPNTAALRLVSQVLALQAQRRKTIWPTLGYVASNMSQCYPAWLNAWDLDTSASAFRNIHEPIFKPDNPRALAGSYLCLHQCEPEAAGPLMYSKGEKGGTATLHLPTGTLRFLWHGKVSGEVKLQSLHKSGGWGLASVAERVVKYLGT